ncbi:MAG: hypothetical protein OSA92_11730 [Pirellulaceae bacterium]|nr:hypothetical protein [Pirellulaceae bacterium]
MEIKCKPSSFARRGNAFNLVLPVKQFCFLGFVLFLSTPAQAQQVFDMRAISDPSTLEIEVVQPWRTVQGPVVTRQKLVTINVGEIWAGQNYRVPVRMVVPADRKALGFHLTGGNSPVNLQREMRPRGTNLELLTGGVGLVMTVVQEPGSYGKAELGGAAEARFAKTLNPHYKIQYWAWPATLMRAVTTAYAESEYFDEGKVAVTGASKNGASPSMAIIHDDRMTALHATVSPIWDSPLRLCDQQAWDQHLAAGGQQRGFSGGHFGPNFNQRVLNAGHTWKDLQGFAEDISDQVFISRNLKDLRSRGVEMLFHPGTHDMVAYDMAWGGAHHPSIPIYLGANSGHGKQGHLKIERDQQNKTVLLLRHFFPDEFTETLLAPPAIETQIENDTLRVTVRFAPNSGEETGRIWWINNRGPDGSPRYLKELIPEENSKEMTRDVKRGVWTTEIKIDSATSRIDLFSNHRKTIKYRELSYPTYISSPYTRVEFSESK